jgi:uncharacterized membrane protein YjgN (DUF898 family)
MSIDTAPASAQAIRFTGERRAFWRLVVRGAVLLMMTLGIYRFWLTTDVRSFLWSNTEIAGESLEYSGTPSELLTGFLFALALLVPVYTAFFIAALDLGTLGELSGMLGFLVLFALGQYAVFRARRYRLSRTIFRGLRFHQEGSAIRYALRAILWWGLTILTLGLAYPWKASRLERYKMRHSFYGDLQGRFDGHGLSLFLRGLPMWILIALPLVAGLAAIGDNFDPDAASELLNYSGDEDPLSHISTINADFTTALVFGMLCAALAASLAVLFFPVFQALTIRWWLSGVRFGPVTLRSRLRTTQVYGAYLRFAGWMLLFCTVLLIVGLFLLVALGFLIGGPNVSIWREWFATLLALGGYVSAMLGFSAVYRATVTFSVWKAAAETLEIQNVDALAHAKAGGHASSPVGEGLADALHVGGL